MDFDLLWVSDFLGLDYAAGARGLEMPEADAPLIDAQRWVRAKIVHWNLRVIYRVVPGMTFAEVLGMFENFDWPETRPWHRKQKPYPWQES